MGLEWREENFTVLIYAFRNIGGMISAFGENKFLVI